MRAAAAVALALLLPASNAGAQAVSQTGFVEGRVTGFPETAPNDATRVVGDALFREEVVLRPAHWFELVGGLDLRANSHDQVEDEWRLDWQDRGLLRPRVSMRQLVATLTARRLRLDMGKQLIRWGRTDVISPTDRFAPHDYLDVINTDLLPVIGARASIQLGSESLEAVYVPQLTPSRLPLLDQRWAPVPPGAESLTPVDGGGEIPGGGQFGGRWRHTGSRIEAALAYFDGYNHMPDIYPGPAAGPGEVQIVRVYPTIRMYGGDLAVPASWLTLKAEVAYVTSPPSTSDEYVLYVGEIERQAGQWVLDVGYAGEVVLESRVPVVFSPDRRLARSVIGRASYLADPRRTVIIEGAVRQSGDGYYGKVEFSQSIGQHWRVTLAGVGLGGEPDDFLGQYGRNSNVSAKLRFSF